MNIASFHEQVSADASSPWNTLQNISVWREQQAALRFFGWFIWPL